MYFTFFITVILKNLFWSKIEHSIPLLSWKEEAKTENTTETIGSYPATWVKHCC